MDNPPDGSNYYLVPQERQVFAIWYNKEIFQKLGLTAPQTYGEMTLPGPEPSERLATCDRFPIHYQLKYPKVCGCPPKHKERLLRFYQFPPERRVHLRTTNPIGSMFATIRLRTQRTKRCGSRVATLQ